MVSLVKCPDTEFLFKIQGETPPVTGTAEQSMKNQPGRAFSSKCLERKG